MVVRKDESLDKLLAEMKGMRTEHEWAGWLVER
jgi:hypothetical protein